jgi:hypothetical protein
VDAYIAGAAPFARPILARLREVIGEAAPQLREEMKWRVPHFVGNGIVVGMAAFKAHVSFGFWRSKEMDDPAGLFRGAPKASMCNIKAVKVSDLPSKRVLTAYVRQAVSLDAMTGAPGRTRGEPAKRKSSGKRPPPEVPDDLLAALKRAKKALATYQGFTSSKQREYVEWITEAKRPETRERRIGQAVDWMAQGKSRHWKHR